MGGGPVDDVRASVDYLDAWLRREEERDEDEALAPRRARDRGSAGAARRRGCGDSDDDDSSSTAAPTTAAATGASERAAASETAAAAPPPAAGTAGSDTVDLTAAQDITIAMVTHGDGGSFWAVAKKGAEQAAADLGITLDYAESNNDPEKQAQLIEAEVTKGVDGIAVSAPNPDAIGDALQKARDAGIPIITLNSGAEQFAELGAITHVGQTETVAGQGAGAKLKEAGVTKLPLRHPRAVQHRPRPALRRGQRGLRRRRGELPGDRHRRRGHDAQRDPDQAPGRHVDRRRPGAEPGHRRSRPVTPSRAPGSSAKLATFDLSGDVSTGIKDGSILFAIDQQQYLQGYLPIVFLYLYNDQPQHGRRRAAGPRPGPGFVDQSNAEQVEQLAGGGHALTRPTARGRPGGRGPASTSRR